MHCLPGHYSCIHILFLLFIFLICSRKVTLFLNRFEQHVSGIYALCCVFSINEHLPLVVHKIDICAGKMVQSEMLNLLHYILVLIVLNVLIIINVKKLLLFIVHVEAATR